MCMLLSKLEHSHYEQSVGVSNFTKKMQVNKCLVPPCSKCFFGSFYCCWGNKFCRGCGWFGAGRWGGTPLGQCPRLGIDTIERASFRLIKWVTASGLQNRIYRSSEEKKSKLEKGKRRTTPQISSARGRDLIERQWVNWKMLLSFCECLAVIKCVYFAFAPPCVSIYYFSFK